jgi:hypothetical protein
MGRLYIFISCLYLIFRACFLYNFIATPFIHLSLSTFTTHFSTFLTAAFALYATSVSGKCFQTGENWGDHDEAKEQLANACNELRGNYQAREVATRCRNNPSEEKSYIFEIENYNSRTTYVTQEECEDKIGAQIENCGHGGQKEYDSVRFRYILYKTSWSTRLLLLTQIGVIRIKGSARRSNLLGRVTPKCGWSIYESFVN